jgi:hypothetical protein
MAYSQIEVSEYARKLGKSERTLWRWVRQGCDLRNPKSLREWQIRSEVRKTNIAKSRERHGKHQTASAKDLVNPQERSEAVGNGETLPPAQKTGAAAALQRLEQAEERAHAQLEAALASADVVQIAACQDFWLKCSETLRRLDLAVEVSRRSLEEQVPKRLACDVALAIADWLRISFAVFLSSEARPLMGFRDVGEFKHYGFERLRSILHMTVRNSLSTNSPIPDWAAEKVKESWNVQES